MTMKPSVFRKMDDMIANKEKVNVRHTIKRKQILQKRFYIN